VRFYPAPVLTAADVADVLATMVPRVTRLLERRGLGEGDEGTSAADEWAEDAPRRRRSARWSFEQPPGTPHALLVRGNPCESARPPRDHRATTSVANVVLQMSVRGSVRRSPVRGSP
jgi:hypothetical protein